MRTEAWPNCGEFYRTLNIKNFCKTIKGVALKILIEIHQVTLV